MRSLSSLKLRVGFTLVELLLYVGLLVAALVVGTTFTWDVLTSRVKSSAQQEAQGSAQFALEHASQEIRKAKSLETTVVSTIPPTPPWVDRSPLPFTAANWQAAAYVPHASCPDDPADGEGCVFALEGDSIGGYGFHEYIIKTGAWNPIKKTDAPISTGEGVTLEFVSHTSCPNDPPTGVGCLFATRGEGDPSLYVYTIISNTWSTKPEFGDRAGGPFEVGAGGSLVFVPSTNCPDTSQDESKGCLFALQGSGTRRFQLFTLADARWIVRAAYGSTGETVGGGGALTYVPPGSDCTTDTRGCIYGLRGNSTTTFKRYGIFANSWATVASLPVSTYGAGGLAYAGSGRIFALGLVGNLTPWFGCYNITLGACTAGAGVDTWTPLTAPWTTTGAGGTLASVPASTPGCTDPGGCIFALRSGGAGANFLRYNVSSSTWDPDTTLDPGPAGGGALAFDGSSSLYAGQGGTAALWKCALADVAAGGANCWQSLDATPQGGAFGAGGSLAFIPASSCPDDAATGCLYALRGGGPSSVGRDVWAYRISSNDWLERADAPGSVNKGADFALVLPSTPITWCTDGKGCLFTFQGSFGVLSSAFWRYDIQNDSWITKESAPSTVSSGGLVYDGTRYLYHVDNLNGTLQYDLSAPGWTTRANPTFPLELSSSCINCLAFVPPGSCPDDPAGCLIFPGNDSTTSLLLLYKVSANTWKRKIATPVAILSGALAYDTALNRIFIIPGGGTTSFWQYAVMADVGWITKASIPSPYGYNWSASIASDTANLLYVFPSNQNHPNEFWRYAKDLNNWIGTLAQPTSPGQRVYVGAALAFVPNGPGCADTAGCLFAFRGDALEPSREFKRYNISANTWVPLANTPAFPIYGAKIVYVPTGQPGCSDAGGTWDDAGCLFAFRGGSSTFWRYNIFTNNWTTQTANCPCIVPAPAVVDDGAALGYDGSGGIYALRGNVGDGRAFWRYNLAANNWTTDTANCPCLPLTPAGAGDTSDLVFVPGSHCGDSVGCVYALRGAYSRTFWEYQVSTGTWVGLADTPDAIGVGGALAYDSNGRLFALGGVGGIDTRAFYQYDLARPASSTTTFPCRFILSDGTTRLSVALNGNGATPDTLQLCTKAGSACTAADTTWVNLTPPTVEVTSFSCTPISSGTSLGEESVQLSLSLRAKNPSGRTEFKADTTLTTTVSLRL